MAYLFLDTTDHLIFGLLSDSFDWIKYIEINEKKGSAIIHNGIYELLSDNGLSLKDVSRVFHLAGPGSYTGIRLSEGMAQVFKWHDIESNSFYHFDIPRLIDQDDLVWFSNAFKNEYFIYVRKNQHEYRKLIPFQKLEEELDTLKSKGFKIYTNLKSNDLNPRDIKYTCEIIKNRSSVIFPKLMDENIKATPFYYRKVENEFLPLKN